MGGLLLGHHPMLLSGFGKTQRDWGDTRFVNYLLEHSYRWILQRPHHESLWDPPFFFPAKGVLAYSESMLGAAPFYWIWRVLGFWPDTSLQLWTLTLSALNFLVAQQLLRRCFRLSAVGASLGGLFFAFTNMRINQVMHHQLFPHFYSLVCVFALFRIFGEAPGDGTDGGWKRFARGLTLNSTKADRHRAAWIAVFFFSAALQLYASFYLGWFLIFVGTLTFLAVLAVPVARVRLWSVLSSFPVATVLFAVLASAFAAPMVLKYMEASRQTGMRSFEEVLTLLPTVRSWLNLGPENWLYKGWQGALGPLPMEHEQRLGLGAITTGLFLVGLAISRRKLSVRLVILSTALLFAVSLWWAPNVVPWKVVYTYFPGAAAMRGVCRIGLQVLLPVGLGLGVLWDFLWERKLWWVGLPLCAFAVLEQFNESSAFSKTLDRKDIQAIVRELRPECEAFLYTPIGGRGPTWKYQNDAMQASLYANVPTVNGYSGNNPPGWGLVGINLWSQQHVQEMERALNGWVNARGLNPAKVCWVKVRMNDGNNAAEIVYMNVPKQLMAGQITEVKVTVQNVGFHPWKSETRHALGSQSPQDNTLWGTQRVPLPSDVEPGEKVTFSFQIRAPAEPGVYAFQWRMVQDGVEWFGPLTEPVNIEVRAP